MYFCCWSRAAWTWWWLNSRRATVPSNAWAIAEWWAVHGRNDGMPRSSVEHNGELLLHTHSDRGCGELESDNMKGSLISSLLFWGLSWGGGFQNSLHWRPTFSEKLYEICKRKQLNTGRMPNMDLHKGISVGLSPQQSFSATHSDKHITTSYDHVISEITCNTGRVRIPLTAACQCKEWERWRGAALISPLDKPREASTKLRPEGNVFEASGGEMMGVDPWQWS